MKVLKLLLTMCALLVAGTVLAQVDTTSVLHPEKAVAVLAWLKGSSVLLMVVVGMAWKYIPALKGWSNDLIPWVNVAVYVLASFAGIAQAATGGGQPHNFATTLILGFLHSGVAKVLYDGWLKPTLDATVGKWTGTV